jgi:glycosyltransferase involved in cell wall biosynthesis
MKKILFGITSLTLGGAERVLVDLANALCDQYDITIFTIYAKGEFEKQLSKKIKVKSLYNMQYNELTNRKKKLVPLKILLYKKSIYKKYICNNYDVEIAFLEGPITRLFSIKNENTKKIAWIHNDITKVFGNGLKSKLKKMLDKKIYSKYDTLVFVSKDNLKKFNEEYKDIGNESLKPIKKEVIYNYIDKENIIKKAEEKTNIVFNKDKINFITVARLVEQKGIDRLIEIHSKLIENGLKHNFYIIGDGPEKEKLEILIKKYKVEKTFKLLGKKENPYPYIKNADYFCLLSRFEGYGMVLEEAKIMDKPIIITNTAAREAVNSYPKAIVLENSKQGIYEGLKKIVMDRNINFNLNRNKTEKYDNSKLLKRVIKLIENQGETL